MVKDFKFIDHGILLDKHLIISDPHIGFEEALSKQGILLPKFHINDIIKRTENMIKLSNPKEIIINGDLKHEFGSISSQEWKDSMKFIDFLSKHAEIKIIRGNHDLNTNILLRRYDIKACEDMTIGGFFLTHGDKIKEVPDKIHTIIIGHEHPAVSIREHGRSERMKCFLKGKFQNKNLVVMPSLNPMTDGHDLIKEKPISPFIKDVDKFEVYGINDGEVLFFGRIKDIKNI